jgi:hypothetical protein
MIELDLEQAGGSDPVKVAERLREMGVSWAV